MTSDNPKKITSVLRAIWLLLPIIILALALWVAHSAFGLPVSDFDLWFESFRESPYIIPIVLATFVAGSFMSLPQWALFAGTIAVLGPLSGGILSWVSTLLSASVNFALGGWLGQSRVQRFIVQDGRIDRFLKQLRDNGFLASFAVRFVPTGPFIFVNMLAGASGLRYGAFIGGTALGIIPKILVVAFLAKGLVAEENRGLVMLFSILAACVSVGLIWLIRRRFKP